MDLHPLDRLGALGDPTRRALFRIVADSATPVGRDAAAQAAGIARSLAAFHLDRLVDAGLLDVEYRRLTGRSGPGAGRPAKLYRPSPEGLQVSLPPRRYERMAGILATGVDATPPEDEEITRSAIDRAAADVGRAIAAQRPQAASASRTRARERVVATLASEGFAPTVEPDGSILLANCPFDAVARDHRPTVCRANLALVGGVLAGLGSRAGLAASLEPADGRCCVVLRPS